MKNPVQLISKRARFTAMTTIDALKNPGISVLFPYLNARRSPQNKTISESRAGMATSTANIEIPT